MLAPRFPAPPTLTACDERPAPPLHTGLPAPSATYSAEAERFIAALDPAPSPADALLVRSLRGLAELLDVTVHGEDAVKNATALVAKLIAVQRELKATRATAEAAAVKSAGRLASGQF